MPEDVDSLIAGLFARSPLDRLAAQVPNRRERSFRRLTDGVVALDLGDEEHVFRVTVERVARRQWRPEEPVSLGAVHGVEAELIGVTVDNFVHVHLRAAPDESTDRLSREHDAALEQWAATASEDRGEVPDGPASRLLRVTTLVSDSLGTAYIPHGGRYGGSGTEWDAMQTFLPGAPDEVRELQLSLQTPVGPPVSVLVPLA